MRFTTAYSRKVSRTLPDEHSDQGQTMITIEKAKSTAVTLVKRYPNLISAEEIVRKAIQEEIVNEKDALAIWARVRSITKTN